LFTVKASQEDIIPKNPENNINVDIVNQSNVDDDIEIIHAFPTAKIVLKIEETTPLDILNSPKHNAVMSRSRKKIKLEQSQAQVTNETPFQVLWKGTQTTPDEELNRIS